MPSPIWKAKRLVPIRDVVDVGELSCWGMPERDYHWLGVVWAVGTHETCHPGPNWRSLIMWGCPVVNSPVFLFAAWPSCRGLLCRRGVQVMLATLWSCSHTYSKNCCAYTVVEPYSSIYNSSSNSNHSNRTWSISNCNCSFTNWNICGSCTNSSSQHTLHSVNCCNS